MIANDREYHVTQRDMRTFEAAITALTEQGLGEETDDALSRRLQEEAMRSHLADLVDEVADYEARGHRRSHPLVVPPAEPLP